MRVALLALVAVTQVGCGQLQDYQAAVALGLAPAVELLSAGMSTPGSMSAADSVSSSETERGSGLRSCSRVPRVERQHGKGGYSSHSVRSGMDVVCPERRES